MKLKTNKIWKMVVVALIITTAACGQQRGGQGGGQQGGQGGPPPQPTAKEIKTMVSDLSKEILLTDEQETQILKLYTAHFEEVKNKMKSGRPERNEMESLKTSFENSVKKVLTKEQQTNYTAYLKKNIQNRSKK